MKGIVFMLLAAGFLFAACSKNKAKTGSEGTYNGLCITRAPLAPPNDSVVNKVQLVLSDGRFSGTNDTVAAAFSITIGKGAYVIQNGRIIFTQDSTDLIYPGPLHNVLGGTFTLVKTGDSLIFQRSPDTGLIGGTTTTFLLRKN